MIQNSVLSEDNE